MSVAVETARCPYCREKIAVGATRCKHCHADLGESSKKHKNPLNKLDTFRTGFLSGILFTLVLSVLIYFQFFTTK